MASSMVMTAPAMAGTVSGTATFRERIALPPDAVFEVVIEDVARADAPATVIGRQRIESAGQPPFRFSIPYKDSDVTPRGRYTVRATVRHQGRLLFTTDTITPVLDGRNQPVELLLKKVGSGPAAQQTSPGSLRCAAGQLARGHPRCGRRNPLACGSGRRWHLPAAADLSEPAPTECIR